jgi:RND family efflux transporter MFP subunit
MAKFTTWIGRLLAVGLPVALGAVTVVYSDTLKQPPAVKEIKRPANPVRVLTMKPVAAIPRIIGYGTVSPAREWRAVARIDGDVAEAGKGLAAGALVSEDDLLFRIDDTDLRLSLAQINAQLGAADVKDETFAASLEIAVADLDLMRGELSRQEQLASQGVATRAGLDAARRQELAARAKVTEIENQRRLAEAEREVLLTQKASLERSLGFAEIRAPYDMRVTDVTAFEGQYVGRGQVLLSGEGVDAAEIAAQFPMGRIGPLLRLAGDVTVMDLKARVRLSSPGHNVMWKAKVVRVGDALDARTQSATVVVRVDDPLAQATAGERPPLRRNMFVEVLLMVPQRELLAAPTEAVRDGTALVVNEDSTLEKRKVATGFTMGNLTVINKGLKAGDQLVITSPTVAVPGMTVKPVEDAASRAALEAEATGKSKPTGGIGQGKGKSKEADK